MCLLLLSGCAPNYTVESPPPPPPPPKLTLINIIDQNGLTETISSKERIAQFETVNFLARQPYKKVMRIFARDFQGNISAILTSYHPNGQPWQYLEIVNSRAMGAYKEWYSTGQLKIQATIIGGDPDLTVAAEKTWLFNGLCQVWDEQGKKTADLPYLNGALEGTALYYHSCGALWKKIPYCQNNRHGLQQIFLESGKLFSETQFANDLQNGPSCRWWPSGALASSESYQDGKLQTGSYWDLSGQLITQVIEGCGKQTLFGKTTVAAIQEYKKGLPEGRVELYFYQWLPDIKLLHQK